MTIPLPDLDRAADFMARSARVLDRLRFAHALTGAGADQVAAAVRAYQNPDGGFGQGLEPDLRTATSQPGAVRAALEVLHEVDRLGDTAPVCDFLVTISKDGGLPFATPAVMDAPHAPWFTVDADMPPSPVFTAPIAGILAAHGVRHRWLDAAVAYTWRAIEAFDPPRFSGAAWDIARIGTSYEARALLLFCQHVGGARAAAAGERLGRIVLERGLVELAPDVTGEVHGVLDHAPRPSSPMRSLFPDDVVAAHLAALVREQGADGGWPVRWAQWNPASTLEWGGAVTVEAVLRLRAYDQVIQ